MCKSPKGLERLWREGGMATWLAFLPPILFSVSFLIQFWLSHLLSLVARQEVEIKHSLSQSNSGMSLSLCFPSHSLFFWKDARDKSWFKSKKLSPLSDPCVTPAWKLGPSPPAHSPSDFSPGPSSGSPSSSSTAQNSSSALYPFSFPSTSNSPPPLLTPSFQDSHHI